MIKIGNENVNNYLMFKLNKDNDEFTIDELSKIEELVLDPLDIVGNFSPIDLSILEHFEGLKDLELINLYIDNEVFLFLSRMNLLERLVFDRCQFEDVELVKNLKIKKLEFIQCEDLVDLSFVYEMEWLESLSLIGMKTVNLKDVNLLVNLKYLNLSYTRVIDVSDYLRLPFLEEIYLDNTNVEDLSNIDFSSVKKLVISDNQFTKNAELMITLILRDVSVVNENMVDYLAMGGN